MNRSATRVFLGCGAVALAAVACAGSGSDLSGDVGAATQFFLDYADVTGVELDRSCVDDAIEMLSPEDAKSLSNAPDASIEFIESAPFNETIDAVGERIFDDCVTRELGQ